MISRKPVFSNTFAVISFLGLLILIMTIGSPVTTGEGLSFFLYLVFSVLAPGMAVFRLFRIPQTDAMEEVLCGFGFGYVSVIAQYFLLASLKWLPFFPYLQAIVALCSVGYLVLSSKKAPEIFRWKEWCLLAVLISVVFGIRYVTYYGRNMLPSPEQDVVFPTQDILFYVGNAISAKKGFPLEEFRFSGQIFKYHYFGSIFLGATSILTGIHTLKLELCLQWLLPMIQVASFAYMLMRRMKIHRNLRIVGMCALLFTAGRELLVYVAYQHIMYVSPFGFDIGLAMGILFVFYLYIQQGLQKFHFGVFAASLLSFFACEGSKAPIAVVLLFFVGCMCLMWLLSSGRRAWAFLYGLPLVAIFCAVFFGFVSDGLSTVTTNVTGLRFDLTGHLYESGLGKVYFALTARGVPGLAGKLAVLLMYFLGCNMAAYGLLCLSAAASIRRKKVPLLSFEGCLLSVVGFGLLLTLLTKQQGNSQMYFAMTSFPLAVILSMRLWSLLQIGREKGSGKPFICAAAILLLSGVISFVHILAPSFAEGREKLAGKSACGQMSNSLSYLESEAYGWVRDMTPENAVCVTNAVLEDAQFESFVIGVCTERQMYMEGWRYVAGYLTDEAISGRRNLVRSFFEGDEAAREAILDAGVGYVVWVKRYSGGEGAEACFSGNKVFENPAVSIYEISR
jgi:hypothetical protein|nr:hypothetical protein [uncultured Acetatifactor sp.]